MKTLEQQLIKYAKYHRSKRNIITHLIGIPLIVVSITWLLYIPLFEFSSLVITPTLILISAISFYYLKLDVKLGILMCGLLVMCAISAKVTYMYFNAENTFYITAVGLFIIGWFFQFVGHYFEGKKPAFVDDLMGLVIGPLFVVVEVLFIIKLYQELENKIVDKAGAYKY